MTMLAATTTSFVTEAMKTALANAFEGVGADVVSIATTALPYAIGIAGLFLAVRLGIRFFKSVAN